MVTPEYLARFDGVMMMTNGNLPMSTEQKAALVDFVRRGGGFVGVHNAALTFYDYPDFGEMLGGYFRRAIRQNHVFVLRVEDREHPATRMLGPSWPIVDELWSSAMASLHIDNLDDVRDQIDPGRLGVVERGRRVTGADIFAAIQRRADYYDAWRAFMEHFDLCVCPTMPCTAFAAGLDFPPEIGGTAMEYLSWTGFTYPFNITGMPAATVQRLNGELNKALANTAVLKRFLDFGMETMAGTPEQFHAFARAEAKRWGPIIRCLRSWVAGICGSTRRCGPCWRKARSRCC